MRDKQAVLFPLNFCDVVVQAWVTRANCKRLSLETLFDAVRVRFVLLYDQ